VTEPQLVPAMLRALARPIQVFFRLEAAGGIALLCAAAAALCWASSPAAPVYHRIFEGVISIGFDGQAARVSVRAIVNDGLMTIFFFVVGMEIKRELVVGELRSFRRALLPAVAALGGMIVPGVIYLLFNRGGPGERGWAIPMATDIAFSIGVLTLLKGRVSQASIVFLTALAIFDDIGGIAVIALFYGQGLRLGWLAVAAAVYGVAIAVGARAVRGFAPYLGLGVLLWIAVLKAGIHATIAGVLLGLAIPARARWAPRYVLERLRDGCAALLARPPDEETEREALHGLEDAIEDLEAPLARFIHVLHPWVAFGIVPLFALANSGVDLSGARAADLLQPVCLGAALGLFLGKQIGIFAFTMAAARLGVSALPGNARALEVYGVSMVGGIGFTVALFIAGLAFSDPALLAQAKLGIVIGSLASGIAGFAWLRLFARGRTIAAGQGARLPA
jgi:NhaA family Na+:H+ antiporter